MNYESFCESLCSLVSRSLDNDIVVKKEKVLKNNGLFLDALCITLPSSSCAPIIYLEPLFEQLQKGAALDTIVESVLLCLKKEVPVSEELLLELRDPQAARSRIVYRLISQASNETLLQDVPWIPFLDLAVIFSLHLGTNTDSQVGALIHNHQASLWNLSARELFAIAKENTPRLFPAHIESLEHIIAEFKPQAPSLPSIPSSPPMLYILTNQTGVYGASCLLYEDVIKDFAEKAASDLLILPSSVHEVLLISSAHITNYEAVRHMICTINQEEVAPEDILSDELYIYSLSDHAVRIWPSCSHDIPGPNGTRNP